jgi:hypothetical protein
MRRGAAITAVGLTIVAIGCTKTEVPSRNDEGRVSVADVESSVDDVECAEPGATLFATGASADDRVTIFEVEVKGGEAEATVRVLRGEDIEAQHVGTGLTASRDGQDVRVEGTFVSFDGPTQSGEAPGVVTFSCEPDTDPGGGSAVVDGQAVSYDLVSCVETADSFEARARVTATPDASTAGTTTGDTEPEAAAPTELLVLHRTLLRSGWVDRIEASGSIAVDVDQALDDPAEAAVDVTQGLFTVRGARVTAEGAAFGPDRVGSVELTCGIDLSVVPED